MIRRLLSLHACLGVLFAVLFAPAARAQGDLGGPWRLQDAPRPEQQAGKPFIRPRTSVGIAVDMDAMRKALDQAPMEGTPDALTKAVVLALPHPDGGIRRFEIIEYHMMEPGLRKDFPDIRTFHGRGVDEPASTTRIDLSPLGFRAQVIAPDGVWAIDPYTLGDTTFHTAYREREARPLGAFSFSCATNDEMRIGGGTEDRFQPRATGTTLRTYRLACAGVPSFTNFYGSPALAQAGLVTIVNRLNQIWESEIAVRFTIVANNQNLMYTDDATDPYTDGDLSAMLTQNQTNITSVIGSANYDVGHVLSGQNLGGLAFVGIVCSSANKSRGGSSSSPPSGDPLAVRVFAHELGHQFGAGHSFNASCGGNRSSSSAFEPGSGSTIMGYAGVCSPDNIQFSTDPMFNQGAYAQMASYISGSGNCSANSATGNSVPTVNAGADFTIPRGTPFQVTATASDANGDSLTYSWEQRDLGVVQAITDPDNGTSPLFRVFTPTSSPTRVFPRLADILDGSLVLGEKYPVVARTLDLRCTVRDNRTGGGGVNTDDMIVTINGTAGPFQVTSPNTSVDWLPGSQTVSWNVAGTNAAPINTANVRILLSTDGGNTFPTVLTSTTPNDGSQVVTIPSGATSQARIRIEAIGNIYFDISDVNFSISCAGPGAIQATDALCDKVGVSWSAVLGATSYQVFRSTTNDAATAGQIGTTSATSFDDTTAALNIGYFYFVRAIVGSCTSQFSPGEPGQRTNFQGTPANFAATDTLCDRVTVSWDALPGATGYDVLRSTTNSSAAASQIGTTAGTSFDDTTGSTNLTYFYWVRPKQGTCVGLISGGDTGVRPTVSGGVSNIVATGTCSGVNISWDNFPAATSYRVLRNPSNSIFGATQLISGLVPNSYADTTAIPGTPYFYFVLAQTPCGATQVVPTPGQGARLTAPPTPTTLSGSSALCTGVDLSWSSVPGATSYDLARNTLNDDASATPLVSTASTTFSDTTAVAGQAYFYFVRANNSCGPSAYSPGAVGSRLASISDPVPGVAAAVSGCPQVSVTWNTLSGAATYEVLRNTTPAIAGATILTSSAAASPFVDSTAAAGTDYWYWVRATGPCGSGPDGSPAAVSVAPTPGITTQPQPTTVFAGQNASFSVASNASAFAWRKDGVPLTADTRITGVSTASLSIANVIQGDAGAYSVLVSTDCGQLESNAAALTVNCRADTDDGTGTGTLDGGVGIEDLLYYLGLFEAGSNAADVDDGTGTGTTDGGVGIEDLLYYLSRFESGC